MLLSIDPSSSTTGYAFLRGPNPRDLVECGLLRGSAAKGAAYERIEPPIDSLRRILSILHDLDDLMAEHRPETIVVEHPSGRAGTGSKRGAKSSLITYGVAAGMILEHCRCQTQANVVPVTERQWTARAGSKAKRQTDAAAIYGCRGYDPLRDPRCDLSDALMLARYWMLGRSREELQPEECAA